VLLCTPRAALHVDPRRHLAVPSQEVLPTVVEGRAVSAVFNGFRERMNPTAPSHRRLQKPVQQPWVRASFLIGLLFAATVIAVAAPQHIKFIRVAQDFLWTFSGVFALLGLTGAVVAGLIATDRLVLYSEHRLLFQTIHRSATIASVGFLFAHVTLQIAFGQAGIANIFLPFGINVAVAFGVIASDLMLVIIVTGITKDATTGSGHSLSRGAT
jgi:hypothetical protein